MKPIKIIAMCLLSMVLVASPASAYTFRSQVADKYVEIYVPSASGEDLFNTADLDTYNNYLCTINYTQAENNTLSGIVQYPVTLPMKYNYTIETASASGLLNRTLTLAWPFVPSEEILFDSSVDTWFRLPINNITIGNSTGETHTIDVRIEKILTEDYTLSNNYILSGCDYSTILNQTISVNDTNYYYNENRVARWNSTNSTGTYPYTHEYNFTWVRSTVPIYKENLYLIVVNLTTMIDSTYDWVVEPLFTECDFNDDETFISFMGSPDVIGEEKQEIECDFDTPMVFHELGTGAFHSIGCTNYGSTTGNATIYSAYWLETPEAVNNSTLNNYSYMIPVYAKKDMKVYTDIAFYFTSGGSYFSNTHTHNVSSGNYMIVATGLINEFAGTPTPSTTIYKVEITVFAEDDNITYLGLWLQNPICLNGEDKGFTYWYDGLAIYGYEYYSTSNMVAYYKIGETIAYVPFLSVVTVPNPLSFDTTISWIEAGEKALAEQQFWATVYDYAGEILGILAFPSTAFLMLYLATEIIEWMGEGLSNWLANNPGIGNAINAVGGFLWEVVKIIYNVLEWMLANGVHLVAVLLLCSVYLMAVILALTLTNGYPDAISKRSPGTLYNQRVLDKWLKEGNAQFHYLFISTIGLISFIWGAILVVGKVISGGLF